MKRSEAVLVPETNHLCALMTYSLCSRRIDASMFVASDDATYIHTHTHTHTHIHTHTYTFTHRHTHTRTYTPTHTDIIHAGRGLQKASSIATRHDGPGNGNSTLLYLNHLHLHCVLR